MIATGRTRLEGPGLGCRKAELVPITKGMSLIRAHTLCSFRDRLNSFTFPRARWLGGGAKSSVFIDRAADQLGVRPELQPW
jgi:hypothetical protein